LAINKGGTAQIQGKHQLQGVGGTVGMLGMSNLGFAEKFDVFVEEVNQLWSLNQRFIDEQVVDAIAKIRSTEHSIREKFNEMDWLARNAEFLSPDSITKTLLAFKELYNTEHANFKNAYIGAKHTLQAVITVVNLLEHTR
jgi:hypothetical protein